MNNKDILSLVRPNIRNLCPYSTARDEYKGSIGIFLDANESPYNTGFNRYPDPHQKALKEKIGRIKGINPANIFIGNGSDEAIDLIYRVFCKPGEDNAVIIKPSYGMYTVAADINDIETRQVRLNEDFSLPTEAILAACDSHTKVLFLCSPNNPSGNAFTFEEILNLYNNFEGILVLDEAYADFSEQGSLRTKVLDYPGLVILQTLSKAWGLAGLRLGLAFAGEEIIRLMSMVKYPYNINQAAIDAASKALDVPIDDKIAAIISERKRVACELIKFECIKKIYPSDANFLLVKTDNADKLYAKLLEERIIVRNRSKISGCEGCLRITIGLKEENDRMINIVSEYEKSDICR